MIMQSIVDSNLDRGIQAGATRISEVDLEVQERDRGGVFRNARIGASR